MSQAGQVGEAGWPQLEPVKQARRAGSSRQVKQAGLSWAAADVRNRKREKKPGAMTPRGSEKV